MTIPKQKTVIIICGPTAVGKTAVAIEIAQHFQTEIISADSRQCFKELNIGVARPSVEELAAVPHHFIATHSIEEEVSAITFEQYALKKTAELFENHEVVIMVGGTGLYIKAFCEGLDAIPGISASIREKIMNDYMQKGFSWLQNEVKEKDPAFYDTGEIKNPQRVVRALEVLEATGQSILAFQKGEKRKRDFNIIKIGLDLPREELVERIEKRVDGMLEAGLIEEVRSLLPHKHLNALQTVGYSELFAWFNELSTFDGAIERIRINTRQYAKRQMTWFRKDESIKWYHPSSVNEIIKGLETRA